MKQYRYLLALLGLVGCSPPNEGNTSSDALTGQPTGSPKSSVPAQNGPFGFAIGQKIQGDELEKMGKPGFYKTASPPKPHADFETVVIEAYPATGICMIRGVGKDLQSDGDGSQVRILADEVAETLSTKYGNSRKVDACSGGDVKCSNQFWMMTMSDGERAYAYQWARANEQMKSVHIAEITVGAGATDISTSYVVTEYVGDNKSACGKARKAISASSL